MSETRPVSPGRLLVVDDESNLVTALLSTLREEGYTVTGATTPTDALEILRRERFDVMLTDLHLPEMDGIALLREALAVDPALIVIMMTGHGTIDTAVDAMKAGAVDYVLKPFKLKSVLAVLGRAMAVRLLRQENEELSRRLAARTRELEAANEELEAFSYSVSHDLRAPLRAIEGFTDMLVEDCENGRKDNVDDYGQRIKRGVRRMGAMIDDLLRMGTALRGELNRTNVDLAELAREIVAKLQTASPAREVELAIVGSIIARGDAGLLRLAMENLLSNAWKYSSRAPVTKIEFGVRESGDERIYFIRDNGVGFDMAEAGRLFAPFQRLHSAAEFEGTGIGLATVQRIVQRHGGRIWAEAELNRGATFSFTLPASA
jgi:signal transduction histidine kinase